MKNKYYEYKLEKSKFIRKHGYKWDLDPTYKIRIYHCYQEESPVSYWDDVGFLTNKQRVVIFWTHPRHEYLDKIEHRAYSEASSKFPQTEDIFDKNNYTKNFKKVGKSRKKVSSYSMELNGDREDFWYTYKKLTSEYSSSGDFVQKCFFKVRQFDYCRAVSICIPIEVRNESELNELVMIVRSLLKQPEKFKELYGDYVYTNEDFNKENL